MVTRDCRLEDVDVPCRGPLHFPHITDYVDDICHLSDPYVGSYVLAHEVEHTYFHFGMCDRKFVPWLFGEGPGLCTGWVSVDRQLFRRLWCLGGFGAVVFGTLLRLELEGSRGVFFMMKFTSRY